MSDETVNFHHDFYVVICPQMFIKLPPCERRIVFQMEQSVSSRWATKGYPETLHLLKSISNDSGCVVEIIENVPRNECFQRKSNASIVVDDLVTGGYHLSGLEGLAQGKAVLGWLDERSQIVIREMTGSNTLPWINVHLENAENVLRNLVADPVLCAAIGRESRIWMERWYNDSVLVQHYVQAYHDLLERPDLYRKARDSDLVSNWRNVTLPDLIWESKKARWLSRNG